MEKKPEQDNIKKLSNEEFIAQNSFETKRAMVFSFIPLFQVIISLIFFAILFGKWYVPKEKVVLFSWALLGIFTTFLMAITKSFKKSVIIECIVFWVLQLINFLKLYYAQEPLTISDFAYITNLSKIASLTENTILSLLWYYMPFFACLSVMFAFIIHLARQI
jgi:hypothetical protein